MTEIMTVTGADFLARWKALDLDGGLVEIVEAHIARTAEIREALRREVATIKGTRAARARSLATGASVPKVAPPVADGAHRRAAVETKKATAAALRALGDSLIVEQLRPLHDEVLDLATGHAEVIGGLRTDAEATRPQTTTEAREAWTALAGLWWRREEIVGLFSELVSDRVVPTRGRAEDFYAWRLYARPGVTRIFNDGPGGGYGGSRFRVILGGDNPPPALLMAQLARDERGRRPGLYTAEQIEQHQREEIMQLTGHAQQEQQRDAVSLGPTNGQRLARVRQAERMGLPVPPDNDAA